jgi:hypothetical protein
MMPSLRQWVTFNGPLAASVPSQARRILPSQAKRRVGGGEGGSTPLTATQTNPTRRTTRARPHRSVWQADRVSFRALIRSINALRALALALLAVGTLTVLVALPAVANAATCPNERARAENSLSLALPDCRAYEQVSPPDKEGQDVEVMGNTGFGESGRQPFQSSLSGESVIYLGGGSSEGNGHVNRNVYLATRGPGGWFKARDIAPVGEPNYVAFSADLTAGLLTYEPDKLQSGPPLGTEAPGVYEDIYRRESDGSFVALNTKAPPDRAASGEANRFQILFAGASADVSHVVFEANDTLTAMTGVAPAAQDPGEKGDDIYEWTAGRLSLVNVLPGNVATTNNAIVGSGERPGSQPAEQGTHELNHAVSADGSRIYWTDVNTGALYLREGGSRTVEVDRTRGSGGSGGGDFQTASADGTRAFFTDANLLTNDAHVGSGANLFEYEAVGEKLVDLTPAGHADVQGVLGASKDGSYVYFIALGNLASGGVPGGDNLYAWHDGTTTFIATLSAGDNDIQVSAIFGSELDEAYLFPGLGSWSPSLYQRAAEASPDGRYLAFTSKASLTGYDNERSGKLAELYGKPVSEVYLYDAATRSLACASCIPTGGPPVGESYLPPSLNEGYRPTEVTEQGAVLFDSQESLLPQDTNGATDIYEYAHGELHLISNGAGAGPSFFAAADPSGHDVFFTTKQRLVAQDEDEAEDLYDARVNGGFAVPGRVPVCGDEAACRGPANVVARAPGPPASASVTGGGNLVLPTPPTTPARITPKPTSKSVKCKRGYVRKRKRCAKQNTKGSSRGRSRRGAR